MIINTFNLVFIKYIDRGSKFNFAYYCEIKYTMNQVTSSLNLSPSKHNDNNFNQITTLINKSRYILSFSNSNVEIIRFISYFKNEVCNNIDLIAPQSIEAIEVNEIWNLFSLLELREELNFADAYCKANNTEEL